MNGSKLTSARSTPIEVRTCAVCGRPLPAVDPSRRGPRPVYCSPTGSGSRSDCAMIAKRCDELARRARSLVSSVTRAPDLDEEQAAAYLQSIKSFLWAEMNAATNLGRLRKAR